jgi:MerR-like DNA binding protein
VIDFYSDLSRTSTGDYRVCIEAIAKHERYSYGVDRMIRIGDFSRLSQVSIKTLRYYDEMGLFKPNNIDRFTGYRYFSASQLPRLNRIRALRDPGLSLDQIAQVLDEGQECFSCYGLSAKKDVIFS